MLTLLQISDLHITTEDADNQFDRDVKIRAALLDDLGMDGRSHFDAILVTGDIAYHGRAEEFLRAKSWLEELRTRTTSNPEALFVVPGNHDINQATVPKESSLWDLHQMLRDPKQSSEERLSSLKAKLKDPALDFLAALKEYCAFAQEYGCPTTCGELAWKQFLDDKKSLEDGSVVRFHGLNSALISDGNDTKANLLLSTFQFTHFDAKPQYVNIVLCHHPHQWLIDGNAANDYFRSQSHIVLCGHDHDPRCFKEGNCVRLYAGAVHPSRKETPYQACYHVLRISVDTTRGRKLHVSVETREWRDKDKCFAAYRTNSGAERQEEIIDLPAWHGHATQPRTPQPTSSAPPDSLRMKAAVPMMSDSFAATRRKLIVHFFRIGALSRCQAAIDAGVWEEGDDALDGQARWARVFDRAEKSGKLGNLWNAVAEKDETLTGQTNPFTSES